MTTDLHAESATNRSLTPSVTPSAGAGVNAIELRLLESLPLVRRAARRICRARCLSTGDCEELESAVLLQIIENDYAVLRQFRGPLGFPAYIGAVVHRVFVDHCDLRWGKWRPSRMARRLGGAATLIERLTNRDGLPLQEALATVRHQSRWGLDTRGVEQLYGQLPVRPPRPRNVALDNDIDVEGVAQADSHVEILERRRQAAKVRATLKSELRKLCAEDRQLLRLRFTEQMSVPKIASRTGVDQARLYPRLNALLRGLRKALRANALSSGDIRCLIGHSEAEVESIFSGSLT